MLNPTRIIMSGGRSGTLGASYERTRREQESQEDRDARLDRQRLRTNHLTPGQRWVPQLVWNKTGYPWSWAETPQEQVKTDKRGNRTFSRIEKQDWMDSSV